jgi:hypothetical protein
VTEQLLKITPFVSRQVDRSVVRMVAQKCKPKTAEQGEYICRVGEPGGSLYIVREVRPKTTCPCIETSFTRVLVREI